jgi:uncharacterized protein YyaL (SSP411 family)
MSRNRLGQETSPYLLQHSGNPVHWQPWDEQAFARARAQDKPVFVSVGYAACHWCHVMAQESFADPGTAELLNRYFISVKVDREERPDIDMTCLRALEMMGKRGGWPVSLFLTPRGEPFWGGTYFPPTAQDGLPAFREILIGIAEVYRAAPAEVNDKAARLMRDLSLSAQSAGTGGTLAEEEIAAAACDLLGVWDGVNGGLKGAPKFPYPSLVRLLWDQGLHAGDEASRNAALLTLDRIGRGGLYDHLGGGFARYAVDEQWRIPHFEKMLCDNALLIDLLTDTWRGGGPGVHGQRVRETVGWLLRDMTLEGGAFATSLAAGSAEGEGRPYLWSESEIDEALGKRAREFKAVYGVTKEGNFAGRSVLNCLDVGDECDFDVFATERAQLLEARSRRPQPDQDDKVLADWNGLAVAALAKAGAVFGESEWLLRARAAFDFVRTHLQTDGRLRHSWRAGRVGDAAVLDDYAAMIRAALALYEASGDLSLLRTAREWTEMATEIFWDKDCGGYRFAVSDSDAMAVRICTAEDQATPAGNGLMAECLIRLWLLTGDAAIAERADALLATFAGDSKGAGYAMATLLSAARLRRAARQVTIIGAHQDQAAAALRATAFRAGDARTLISTWRPNLDDLPQGHPAADKGQVGSRATAYVCIGRTCSLPVTEPSSLVGQLRQ